MLESIRKRVRLTGVVQGVGFRPFVWNRATRLGLAGWVRNDSSGVTIELQGSVDLIDEFLEGLGESLPPLATVDSMSVCDIDVDVLALGDSAFSIRQSQTRASQSTPIPPEISVCDDCLRELTDRADRRFGYPFINCTNCGPRFTIIEDLPYDRSMTTMKAFSMCGTCQAEYDDPSDRRFHAQPNACAACGPGVWFVARDGVAAPMELIREPERLALNTSRATESFHAAIAAGQVVAIKGVGGFHLACDASSRFAVAALRERKGRVDKPLAVMVRDVEQARLFADVSPREVKLLESRERPIVLLTKRGSAVGDHRLPHESVAPGNDFIGVLLPYSPLHYLVLGERPLVMTSGNIAEEPIARTNEEAARRLGKVADGFLFHNRDIGVVCDDSVVRCVGEKLLPIRRSRGYAPMPVRLSSPGRSVLAVGGEIKTTFCVTRGDYAYMSQHVGDMGNIETLDAMRRSVDHFLRLFRIEVEAVAADLHPGYLSGQWAEEFATSLGVPLIRVQHHHAHAASLMAEHGLGRDEEMLACCFDGTGFGTDGAIWGGEFLVASARGFERFGQLKYVPLPGGDTSIRRPYRAALSQLRSAGIEWSEDLPCVAACRPNERGLLSKQLEKNLNCVSTSSMGRLFDAVASLTGIRHEVNYEAQAAMEMEAFAVQEVGNVDPEAYSFSIGRRGWVEVDAGWVLRRICEDIRTGASPAEMAARFHHAVANLVCDISLLARDESGVSKVGLTGGVFQNVLLLRLVERRLVQCGFEVLTHSVVPANDGGIALGQALVAQVGS